MKRVTSGKKKDPITFDLDGVPKSACINMGSILCHVAVTLMLFMCWSDPKQTLQLGRIDKTRRDAPRHGDTTAKGVFKWADRNPFWG